MSFYCLIDASHGRVIALIKNSNTTDNYYNQIMELNHHLYGSLLYTTNIEIAQQLLNEGLEYCQEHEISYNIPEEAKYTF